MSYTLDISKINGYYKSGLDGSKNAYIALSFYDMFSGKSTAVFVSWMCFAVLLLFVIFGVSIFTGRKKTERTK